MIKTQENFHTYSLSDVYNILKAQESQVKEIAEENKLNFGGPMVLVSKTTAKDVEYDEEAINMNKVIFSTLTMKLLPIIQIIG